MKLRSIRNQFRSRQFSMSIKALAISGLAVGSLLGTQSTTLANSEDYWIGTTGDFSDPTQWSLGRVPVSPAPDGTGDDNADVFNGGTVTISSDQTFNDTNAGGTNAGVAGDGTYTQTAGNVTAGNGGGWFRLGTSGGTSGTYNLQGGTFTFGNNGNAQANIGEAPGSTAAINISGGTMNIPNANYMAFGLGGDNGGATSTLTMTGGALNMNAGHWSFGDGGGATGTATISGSSAIDSNGELWIGQRAGGNGTFNMQGGTLNMHNWLAIARQDSTGTLNMSGGTITKDSANNGGSHITLAGLGTAQTATVNQSGGDVIIPNGGNSVWIGETATGIWNISGGTLQANDSIAIGQNGGTGTLNLQSATDTTGPLTNGGGTEVVTSPTVTLGSDDSTHTGAFGGATVNLNGGTLSTNGFAVGYGTGPRTINFNGGVLQSTAFTSSFLGDTTVTTTVQAGGAIIDTNGSDVGIPNALVNGTGGTDGGLTKRGAGLLTLTGANSYVGPTTVSTGSLAINGSIGAAGAAGAVTVAQGAILSGTGTLTLGANAVAVNGVLSPGATPNANDIGTLTVSTTGTITLASTARMAFDIANPGNKDLLTATGAQLIITPGSVLALRGTVAANTTYTLFSGLTTETGNFTTVTGGPSGLTPTFTFTGGNYNLTFVSVPEPSTWAMGIFGLSAGALWMRRRRTV